MAESFDDVYEKDPSAVLDYGWDWSDWLTGGEEIVTAVVTPQAGLTLDSSSHDGVIVTAWLSGGETPAGYAVTCHVTTDSTPPREDDRTIYVIIRER